MKEYVVILNIENESTYPQVKLLFENEEYSPEQEGLNALENENETPLIIDLNETGTEIVNCQSLSPFVQVRNVSLDLEKEIALIRVEGVRSSSGFKITESNTESIDVQLRELEDEIRELRSQLDYMNAQLS